MYKNTLKLYKESANLFEGLTGLGEVELGYGERQEEQTQGHQHTEH